MYTTRIKKVADLPITNFLEMWPNIEFVVYLKFFILFFQHTHQVWVFKLSLLNLNGNLRDMQV